MGLKARLSSNCTKRANNGVDLVTSRKINTRLARPIVKFTLLSMFMPLSFQNAFVYTVTVKCAILSLFISSYRKKCATQ